MHSHVDLDTAASFVARALVEINAVGRSECHATKYTAFRYRERQR